jgi:hypothetical protein
MIESADIRFTPGARRVLEEFIRVLYFLSRM